MKKSPIYQFLEILCTGMPTTVFKIKIIIIIIIFIFLTSRLLQAAKRDLALNILKMQIKGAYETSLNVF